MLRQQNYVFSFKAQKVLVFGYERLRIGCRNPRDYYIKFIYQLSFSHRCLYTLTASSTASIPKSRITNLLSNSATKPISCCGAPRSISYWVTTVVAIRSFPEYDSIRSSAYFFLLAASIIMEVLNTTTRSLKRKQISELLRFFGFSLIPLLGS